MSYKVPELKLAALVGRERLHSIIPDDVENVRQALSLLSQPIDEAKVHALQMIQQRLEENCKTHIEAVILLSAMVWSFVDERNPDDSKSGKKYVVGRLMTELKQRLRYNMYKNEWQPNKESLARAAAAAAAAMSAAATKDDDEETKIRRSFLDFYPDKPPAKKSKASAQQKKSKQFFTEEKINAVDDDASWNNDKTTTTNNNDDGPPSKKIRKSNTASFSKRLKAASNGYVPSSGEYAPFTQDAALSLERWIATAPFPLSYEVKKRCWQVRCIHDDNGDNGDYFRCGNESRKTLRILIVHGATPIFALTKFVAEAFDCRPSKKTFDPTLTKGSTPPGSHWTIERGSATTNDTMAGIIGTQTAVDKTVGKGAPFFHDKTVQVYQVLRNRGDTMVYRCCSGNRRQKITLLLDGYEFRRPEHSSRLPCTPKCVGASNELSKYEWNDLNEKFLERKPKEWGIVSSSLTEEELNDAVNNMYKIPLFDNEGKKIDQRGMGFEAVANVHRLVALPFVD